MSRTCQAFSKPIVNQVKAQNLFGANPNALNRLEAAYKKDIKWRTGQTIVICFLRGTELQKSYVRNKIMSTYFNKNKEPKTCNLNLNIEWINVTGQRLPSEEQLQRSHVRIAFDSNEGAYSYVGNDNNDIPKSQKTMNLGWLEMEQNGGVVLHEFGHMFGLIHEQQSKNATIKWNRKKVFELFSASPNFWNQQQIQTNVLDTVDKNSYNASAYDPQSIMHYIFDCGCFQGCQPPTGLPCQCSSQSGCDCEFKNVSSFQFLSKLDIETLQEMYPFDLSEEIEGDKGIGMGEDSNEIIDRETAQELICEPQWNTGRIIMLIALILAIVAVTILAILYATKK